jgi:hypothetical protein
VAIHLGRLIKNGIGFSTIYAMTLLIWLAIEPYSRPSTPHVPVASRIRARRTDPHARTVVAPASVSITGESASSATTNGRGPWPRNQDAAFALVVFDVLDVLDVPDVLDDSKRRLRHARRRCTADFMA